MPRPDRFLGRVLVLASVLFWHSSAPGGTSRFFFSGDGRIVLGHGHFAEKLDVRYRDASGGYDSAALARIAHFFRSREDGREGEVALRTIELIDFIQDRYKPKQSVLMSGYRSPEFNADLRAAGARAAQASLHTEGLAADIAFVGVDLKKLWIQLREQKVGGIGYYKKEGFLHVDSGRPRFWEPQTSKVEQNISRGNAKIFARTEFDRYPTLDGAEIRLHGVTLLPLRISASARRGSKGVTLAPMDRGVPENDGCIEFAEGSAAYRLKVLNAGLQEAGREAITLITCQPRLEATPEEFETNLVELP